MNPGPIFIGCELDVKSQKDCLWAIREFGKKAEKVIDDVINRTSLALETDAKEKLKSDGHIVTGRLRASIHAEIKNGYLRGNEAKASKRMGKFTYTDTTGNSYDGYLEQSLGDLEAAIGTNVEYAASIEFGSKAHVITPKNGKVLAFQMSTASNMKGKAMYFNKKTKRFNRKASDNTLIFATRVTIPAREGSSFMGYAAERQRPKFIQRMTDALNKLIQSEQRV